jgi:hypothetical protein
MNKRRHLLKNMGNNFAAHGRKVQNQKHRRSIVACMKALCNYVHVVTYTYRSEKQSGKMLN